MAKEKTGVCLVIGTVRKVHEDLPGPPKGRLMDYCMRLADLPVLKSFARRRQCCVQVCVFSRTTSCYVTHINTFGTLRPSKRKGVRNIQPHNIVKLYACLRESCLELLCFAVGRLPFQHARCPPACTQLRPKQVRFRAPHKQRRGQYKNNVRC